MDIALRTAILYRAYYEDTGRIIYTRRPNGNLVGELPIGTMPEAIGECGTLDRRDGGDPYERAIFVTGSGRRVIVMRMES